MANFKAVGGPRKYVKLSALKPGEEVVVGKYVGRSPNKFDANNMHFDFKPSEGPMVTVNYSGHLNYLISTYVKEGDLCKVTYLGKGEMEDGRKPHNFEVQVAESEAQLSLGLNTPVEDSSNVSLSDLD